MGIEGVVIGWGEGLRCADPVGGEGMGGRGEVWTYVCICSVWIGNVSKGVDIWGCEVWIKSRCRR